MGKINRIPKGFLDLIGAEQQGKTPPQYSDAVAPVMDLTALYEGQTLGGRTLAFAHTVVGNTIFFEIPSSETWVLLAAAVLEQHGLVTEYVQFEFFVQSTIRPVGTGVRQYAYHTTEVLQGQAANELVSDAHMPPQRFVLHSGVQLGIRVTQRDGGAGRTATVQYLAYRLNS